MTGIVENKPRDVIPRWRPFKETTALRELGSSLPIQRQWPEHSNSLAQQKADWKKHQSIGHAADLVGSALVLRKSHEARDAAEFLLRNESKISHWVKKLAERALPNYNQDPNPSPPPVLTIKDKAIQQIRKLKPFLRDEPQNPISQIDLAYAYTNLGLNEKASKHIIIATQLAPNNRFVLRSACRFWLHIEQKDKAHDILVKSDRTKHDPWLLAAEIAVGNHIGVKPQLVKKAKKLLADKEFLQLHLSELASAVATIEYSHGHIPHAKKLFAQSLKEPTDNSLAQAVWMSSQENFIILTPNHWLLSHVFEAQARSFVLNKKWEQAVQHCKKWQQDQPFVSDAAIHGSFVAATILEDFQEANNIAQIGLVTNPQNVALLNNAAFALINLGKYDEAKQKLSQIPHSENDSIEYKVAQIATTGLLHYRKQNPQKGRQLYNQARSLAKNQSTLDPTLYARATAFHAIEEYPHRGPDYNQLYNEAIQLLKKYNDTACNILAKKLLALKKEQSR